MDHLFSIHSFLLGNFIQCSGLKCQFHVDGSQMYTCPETIPWTLTQIYNCFCHVSTWIAEAFFFWPPCQFVAFLFSTICIYWFFFKIFIYLFLDRGEEKERNINVWLPLTYPPHWGPGLQPSHLPWLGIGLLTLWFAGQHSVHWATTARATEYFFKAM